MYQIVSFIGSPMSDLIKALLKKLVKKNTIVGKWVKAHLL